MSAPIAHVRLFAIGPDGDELHDIIGPSWFVVLVIRRMGLEYVS